MKQILTKAMMAVFLLITFSCKKDDSIVKKETLSVEVKQNVALPLIITSKEEVVFDLTITSSSAVKMKSAILSLNENSLASANASADGGEINMQTTYKATVQDIGSSLIFRLTVSDENGNTIDKDFVVYVEVAPADISINIPANAPVEINDNESVSFNIDVVSGNDIRYIKTFVDQKEITALKKEVFNNPKIDNYAFNYQPASADAGKTLSFTIEVMDVLGNIVKKTYSLNIKRSQQVDFNLYPNVNLGAQRATDAGPFFSSSKGEVYVTIGSATKSADIDFATFFSGSTRAFNLVSPTLATVANNIYTIPLFGIDALANWTTRNLTLIKKLNIGQTEFDLIASGAEIENLYTGSSVVVSESSGGLANGNVIVFKTVAGKYGALYVKSRSSNANTGYLTVDIKVQK
jgi:hypothetical protein